jgi:two-component system response regulator CpxR
MRPVLIIEDDVKLCAMLREYLLQHGINLDIRHYGREGLEAALSGQHDFVLLDVMLPDMDGFEVLEKLRARSDLYVMLLTARGHASDRIRGLHLGADDYLPKPFDPEELLARIRAIFRRGAPRPGGDTDDSKRRALRLTIDSSSRVARYGDYELDLTDIELSLLETFLLSPGVVLTREELMMRVFHRSFHPLDRSLDMHVSRLRRKLRMATPLGNHIKTIRSSGYLFSTVDL